MPSLATTVAPARSGPLRGDHQLAALYTDALGLRNLVVEISRCCRGTLGRSKRGHPAAWEHQEYISWEQSFSGVQESLTAARYFPLCFCYLRKRQSLKRPINPAETHQAQAYQSVDAIVVDATIE